MWCRKLKWLYGGNLGFKNIKLKLKWEGNEVNFTLEGNEIYWNERQMKLNKFRHLFNLRDHY